MAATRLRVCVVLGFKDMGTECYNRAELPAFGERMPERGPLCACCGARIPQFADLAEADESRVRHLIQHGRVLMALAELQAATGCSPCGPRSGSVTVAVPSCRIIGNPPVPTVGKG